MSRLSFEDVLGTNYVPGHNERYTIKIMVESMEAELVSLDQVTLPQVAERDKLKDKILACKALLAPTRRLPSELVREIFNHSLPSWLSKMEGSAFPRPRVSETPLSLAQVSRHWRQIALTTPSLWSAIKIPLGWGTEGLQEWISRAGSCNLSFEVVLQRRNVDILKLLASHQQRWKEVIFPYDECEIQIAKRFMASLSPNYDNLQSMELGPGMPMDVWEVDDNDTVIRMAIGSASNFTHLRLYSPIFQIFMPDISSPLRLRDIRIESESITSVEFLLLLRLSPVVESVCLDVSIFDITDSGQNMLTLANLKHLELSGECRTTTRTSPLDYLSLPALEELSFNIQGISP